MRKRILIAIGAVAIALLAYYIYSKQSTQLAVKIHSVQRGTLQKVVSGSGEVEAVNGLELSFPSPGKVATVSARLGDIVEKGQILIQLDTEVLYYNLQQAKANRNAAFAAYESAKSARTITYDDWKEDLASPSEYVRSQLDQAEKAVAQAKAKLEAAEAQLSLAQHSYRNASLTSPIKGTVVELNADVGELIGQNPAIHAVTVADLHLLKFAVEVEEDELGNIEPKNYAHVFLEAWKNEAIPGKVTKIAPKASKTSSGATVYKIDLTVETDKPIRLGMTGRAEIIVEEKNNVIKIPFEALLKENNRDYIYKYDKGVAKKQTVEIGMETDNFYEVTEGLVDNDKIIVSELTKLQDGIKVSAESEL